MSGTPAAVWMRSNWATIESAECYQCKWIAASKDGVVASSEKFEDVISEVLRCGLQGEVIYAYVDSSPQA